MSTSLLRRLIAPLLLLLAAPLGAQVVTATPASALPCTTPACHTGPRYKIIDLTTSTNSVLYGAGAIAECDNPRSTCTITRAESRSTTVQTSFGLSAKWVSAGVNVTLGVTSSTTVSCTSPKLKKGQIYRAYVRGKFSIYRIQKTYAGRTSKSGILVARQPYKNAISCRVESL